MSNIYEFFDDHLELCAAVIFGITVVSACVALAAALAGAL